MVQFKNIGYLFQGKVSAKGEEYWSGSIIVKGEKWRITVYNNKNKQNSEQPDKVIYGRKDDRS